MRFPKVNCSYPKDLLYNCGFLWKAIVYLLDLCGESIRAAPPYMQASPTLLWSVPFTKRVTETMLSLIILNSLCRQICHKAPASEILLHSSPKLPILSTNLIRPRIYFHKTTTLCKVCTSKTNTFRNKLNYHRQLLALITCSIDIRHAFSHLTFDDASTIWRGPANVMCQMQEACKTSLPWLQRCPWKWSDSLLWRHLPKGPCKGPLIYTSRSQLSSSAHSPFTLDISQTAETTPFDPKYTFKRKSLTSTFF